MKSDPFVIDSRKVAKLGHRLHRNIRTAVEKTIAEFPDKAGEFEERRDPDRKIGRWFMMTYAGLDLASYHLNNLQRSPKAELLAEFAWAKEQATGQAVPVDRSPPDPKPRRPTDPDADPIAAAPPPPEPPAGPGAEAQPEPESEPLSGKGVMGFLFDNEGVRYTVRGVLIDGEPWVVGIDAAKVLGYEKPHDALARHCKGSVKRGVPTPGGPQDVILIPEPDLYRLIMRSHMPDAERFQDFVCGTVLPQIRKTGRYGPPPPPPPGPDALDDPIILRRLLLGKMDKIDAQAATIAELAPKAAALDRFADRKGMTNITGAAKLLGLGPKLFKDRLLELEYLHYSDRRLAAQQVYINKGFFTHRPVAIQNDQGFQWWENQVFVTGRGLAHFAKLFGVGVRAVLGQGVLGPLDGAPQ
jgi:anti-repressor protein